MTIGRADKMERKLRLKMLPVRHLHSQLQAAANIWREIEHQPHPADRWLGNYFHRWRKKFGSRDRRFLSETIYALFRHKTYLETWAQSLGPPEDPRVLVLLAAVLENLVSRKDFEDELSERQSRVKNGASLYQALKEGVLPSSVHPRSLEEKMSLEFSFPLWLVKRWTNRYGLQEATGLIRSLQERPPLVIRTNPLRIQREDLIRKFRRKNFKVTATSKSPFGIVFKDRVNLFDSKEFREGLFEIQDEGSQLVCQRIDPQPGEVIWDVCAGGGGKSLLMAALMKNKGRIIATDIRPQKLGEL
ncbi:MAG: hypothetical protein NC930_01655, partial [Candidatus Omnitrophica bacterium]|nr:hypothetical protein [Candidatus Omnitrophota bacterium]